MMRKEEEEPLSPMARVFESPDIDHCFVIKIRFKTKIKPEVVLDALKHTVYKHPHFSSKLVIWSYIGCLVICRLLRNKERKQKSETTVLEDSMDLLVSRMIHRMSKSKKRFSVGFYGRLGIHRMNNLTRHSSGGFYRPLGL